MSRRARLQLTINLFLALALCSLAIPWPSHPAAAESRVQAGITINVTTQTDELNNDGDCSLREAIRAANLNAAVDACPAGIGFDTVALPP